MKRKYPEIDLLELYSKCSHSEWNIFLATCEQKKDLKTLEETLYGVQAGMDSLAKKNLNTPKIINWFIRIERSLEISIQNVIRSKTPNPLDNPLNKKDWMHSIDEKRERDRLVQKHIRKISF